MPAAAVIPAPRAYTNIAAVKALVVSHWAAGLSGAGVCRVSHLRVGLRCALDLTPGSMSLLPHHQMV